MKTKLFTLLLAVAASVGTIFAAVQEFTVTISTANFNKTSYAANNNEKTSTAVSKSDPSVTMDVKWTSNQMMLKSDESSVQCQKTNGTIYNSAAWGTVKNIVINDGTNLSYTIGATEKPTTTATGGFFQIKTNSSGAGYFSSIVITFEADIWDYVRVQIGDLYYNLDVATKTAEVTSQTSGKYSGNITIPASVEYNSVTYTVTSIGSGAFSDCSGLTSVIIGNSVTSIGMGAFSGCTGLTSVTIGNSVTSIGTLAFEYCSGLISIEIPNSVTIIGGDTFKGCEWLNIVTLNSNAIVSKSYLKDIFGEQVTEYVIGNSVTSIGNYAFKGCKGLTSVTIGNSVTSIGIYAFEKCSSLTSVTIPNSVTSIGYCAFQGCSGLTSVTIGNSVTRIGEWAFFNCTGLTSVTISKSVTSIGDYAFSGCSSLTSVTIPNSVTSIGASAFYGCSGLTSVTIPISVTSIGNYAFKGCTGLTSVTIPNSVTSIGRSAFYGCISLTTITIPNRVTRIEDYAFWNCTGLTSITCEATNPPTCGDNAFYAVPQSIPLYVPFGSEDAYRNATGWSKFTNIQPIKADKVDITTTEVVPDETSVNIAWPKVPGAASYELVIKDKNGKVVCTLVFDAEGRLLSIAFNAPARDNMPQQTQVAGFAFTVTGLNSGTTYNYSIVAKNSNGNTLNTESGSFKTTGESTGLQNVTDQLYETKFIRDGQLFIQRGKELFNAQGARVE